MSTSFWAPDGPKIPDIRECLSCERQETPNPQCRNCKGTGSVNIGDDYAEEFTCTTSNASALLELLEIRGYGEGGSLSPERFPAVRARIAQLMVNMSLREPALLPEHREEPGRAGHRLVEEGNLVQIERLGPTMRSPGRNDAWVVRYLLAMERLLNVAQPLGIEICWG